MEINKIYNENCLETMARMPDRFVDCLVTSPPYYNLRSYGTEPQVWGGDASCEHVWGETLKNPKADTRTPEEKIAQGGSVGSNVATLHWANGNLGNFCQLCNAWRGELGLEPTFDCGRDRSTEIVPSGCRKGCYICHLIDIFREVKRVLKPTGTVWVNLGDSYGTNSGNSRQMQNGNGGKSKEAVQTRYTNPFIEQPKNLHKSLLNIPSRFAIAMTDELHFIQRNKINWWKRACMPSSAKDRFTVDFEDIYFFVKNPKYYFEQQLESLSVSTAFDRRTINEEWSIARPNRGYNGQQQQATAMLKPTTDGYRNMRTTWDIPFEPSGEEHYAAYPTKLVERMIKAGCPENGLVYDPFGGTATTAVTAHKLGRNWICSELQPKYVNIAERRLSPHLNQPSLI